MKIENMPEVQRVLADREKFGLENIRLKHKVKRLEKYEEMWNTLENKVRDGKTVNENDHIRYLFSEMLDEILQVKIDVLDKKLEMINEKS